MNDETALRRLARYESTLRAIAEKGSDEQKRVVERALDSHCPALMRSAALNVDFGIEGVETQLHTCTLIRDHVDEHLWALHDGPSSDLSELQRELLDQLMPGVPVMVRLRP